MSVSPPVKMSTSKENITENTNATAAAATAPTTTATVATVVETPPALILHQFPRNQFGPSPSPFALKLETYLRLAKITYANDFSKPQSAKEGKCPWITYNGEPVADSSVCVEFLKTNKVGDNLNAWLSSSDKAVSRAFQKLVEEEMAWVLALWRWVYDKEESIVKSMHAGKIKEFFIARVVRSNVKKFTHGHGIGRHTQQEVMQMGQDDIRAVSDFLGEKKYFMGDAVSDIDCTLFGLFAQILYTSPTCPLNAFIRENALNIVNYCDRLKAEAWPDWEDVCNSAKPVEKAKVKTALSMDVTPAAAVATVTNGTSDHNDVAVSKSNGTVNGGTTTVTTTTVVAENFTPTKHGDILVQEIESTKHHQIAALSSLINTNEDAAPAATTHESATVNGGTITNGHHHGGDACAAAESAATGYDNAAVDTTCSVATN